MCDLDAGPLSRPTSRRSGHPSQRGEEFRVECPTGSGQHMTLKEVSAELARRLMRLFLRDEHGNRPFNGGNQLFQRDPQWRDYILFHEYFHGDNGAGIGATHQTGWTGLVASLIQHLGEPFDIPPIVAGASAREETPKVPAGA